MGMRTGVMVRAALLAATGFCGLGCAAQAQFIDRGPTAGVSPCSFWPPPPSTGLALTQNTLSPASVDLREVAGRIASELQAAGYPEPRWYPVGLSYVHGFAATTRLEAINDDGRPK